MHDPGALYDLVAPSENAQKPAGEWNHMTITAQRAQDHGRPQRQGSLDDQPGRMDRARQAARRIEPQVQQASPSANSRRTGYLGFQDHGSDCWFKNVKIKEPGLKCRTSTPGETAAIVGDRPINDRRVGKKRSRPHRMRRVGDCDRFKRLSHASVVTSRRRRHHPSRRRRRPSRHRRRPSHRRRRPSRRRRCRPRRRRPRRAAAGIVVGSHDGVAPLIGNARRVVAEWTASAEVMPPCRPENWS